jgi:hypothetical protein
LIKNSAWRFSHLGGFWLHGSRAATAGVLSSLLIVLFEQSNADGRPDGGKRILCLLPGELRRTGLLAHRDGDDSDEKFVHVHIDYFNV